MDKKGGKMELLDTISELSYADSSKKSCFPTWLINKKEKKFLGRTFTSWVQIIIFYAVFYFLLAIFFLGMLYIFLMFIVPAKIPMRTGENSLMKYKPGLSLRPIVDYQTTFIRYSKYNPETQMKYIQNIDMFLGDYYRNYNDETIQTCKEDRNEPSKLCKFDMASLGPCGESKLYGYNSSSPCVFVKINKIFGWIPDIKDASFPHPTLTCEGSNPLDVPNLGEVEYFPSKNGKGYFDNKYFPFLSQQRYNSPFVAVHLKNLVQNVIVHVKCTLGNMKNYDENDKEAVVEFEVNVD